MTGGTVRREYTLAELAAAVGMTERNVRAYRSRGLIRPPRLRGRVGYYDLGHLSQLRLVQALTGRGLSLQVVAQLIDKGLAQHELARLIRQDLPEGPALPLSPVVMEELTREDPSLFDAMVDSGLARAGASGPEVDPALLALAFQLAGQGVAPRDVARVLVIGARAAGAAAEQVRQRLRAAQGPATADGSADARTDRPADVRADDPADAHDPVNGQVDATTTAVALELTAMAFRIALEWRLSRPEP
jgi:DNA-binding transcriptional MerR regulator